MIDGKTVVITGANSGIGRETARGLAKMGAHVVMVCRNRGKGEAAQKDIVKDTGNKDVDLLVCDLGSLGEVRDLAAKIEGGYPRLDVLINNAGLWGISGKSADGFERTVAVNYFAPFLLTNLLLDKLKASAPSRIVSVSSIAHYRGQVDIGSLGRGGGGWGAYSTSKLEIVMFTHELARRLAGTGVTANCLHPGVVATGLWGGAQILTRPFMMGSKEGAQTSIFLASSPDVEGVTGEYFDDKKVKKSSEQSYDEAKSRELWDATAKLVGIAA